MAAIDTDIGIVTPAFQPGRRKATLALSGTAIGLGVAIASFLWHGGDGNAARYAAQMVFRAASIAFLVYYLAVPLARLVRTPATLALARQRTGLALAFVCIYAVFLGCTLAPDYMSHARVPLATLTFCAFSGLVLAVVLAGEYAGRAAPGWRSAWRAMETLGVAYFWLVFAVDDLNHIAGPHRVDHYYDVSLLAFTLAVLVRFADSFVQRYRLMPELH
ncbi:MAG TPA: hypothetical protein VG889_22220 [Rhizomicrobium sp.]|nr:hypothetical protein [Rhizomicrobium sp.]